MFFAHYYYRLVFENPVLASTFESFILVSQADPVYAELTANVGEPTLSRLSNLQ